MIQINKAFMFIKDYWWQYFVTDTTIEYIKTPRNITVTEVWLEISYNVIINKIREIQQQNLSINEGQTYIS